MQRVHQKISILIVILALGLMASLVQAGGLRSGHNFSEGEVRSAAPPPGVYKREAFSLYFTDSTREDFYGGPETDLLAAIDAAKVQVDIAAYDLNLWGMRDALIQAHRRGVVVRAVVNDGALEREEVRAIMDAGIPLVAGRPEGLMHNKFVVIDRMGVWTGSMNFTLNGAYRHDNHLIWLAGKEIAAIFLAEFEEMFSNGLFGAFSPQGEPKRVTSGSGEISQFEIDILFSPDDQVAEKIVQIIEQAAESVHFMVFSFTSDDIGEAMLAKSLSGVRVSGIFDESQLRSNRGSEYDRLIEAGIDVKIDGSRYKLHHKVIIVDEKIVVAGSYNLSASAETRNDENVLIIYDEAIAAVFLSEWERVYAAGW